MSKETQAHLLKTSKIQNKKQIPLSYLFINCISAKSLRQILSLKEEYTLQSS